MKSGDVISGKYRLTKRIGVGAMGAVWEALNERTGRRVALKLLLNATPDHRIRLLREARACGSLEHPNVVELLDVGETEQGDPFLVMQLLSGETLSALCKRRRRLEVPLVARIGRDIAGALAAAQDARIIHRDLKPANIFLHRDASTPEGDFILKVLDFGVSKQIGDIQAHVTATGMMVGSPAYMSPEQIRVDKDIDTRSDLWSLGIILFEMLTGSRPFIETPQLIIHQVLMAPIPPVSKLRPIPPGLDAIVARCLERDRARRYQDAREIGRDLAAFAEVSHPSRGNPLSAHPSSPAWPAQAPGAAAGPGPGAGSALRTPLPLAVAAQAPVARAGSATGLAALERTAPLPHAGPADPAEVTTLPRPVSAAQLAPVNTQALAPSATVPSWRAEMKGALEKQRQARVGSSPNLPTLPEHLVQGGTLALPAEARGRAGEWEAQAGAVTTTAPLVQPGGGASAVAAAGGVPQAGERKGGKVWVLPAVGLGLVAVVGLVLLFVDLEPAGSESGASVSASTALSGVAPTSTPEAEGMRAAGSRRPAGTSAAVATSGSAAGLPMGAPGGPASASKSGGAPTATINSTTGKKDCGPSGKCTPAKPLYNPSQP